ncbi:hypothetical protein C8R41DRAFT_871656 [Lentinula lateritia]|uniref:Uncharacterized protein n=1 Tax=Lentinula lateritia TaxID=40482 RepID=A0ABQ8V4W6_9AGAR|nr:hypothetical protein C8R41DRAFT_871656 [Lentinula lateritia]
MVVVLLLLTMMNVPVVGIRVSTTRGYDDDDDIWGAWGVGLHNVGEWISPAFSPRDQILGDRWSHMRNGITWHHGVAEETGQLLLMVMAVDADVAGPVPVDVTLKTQYPYLHTVLSVLPKDIAHDLRGVLGFLERGGEGFVCGGGWFEENKDKVRGTAEEWVLGQKMFRELVKSQLGTELGLGLKRGREEAKDEDKEDKEEKEEKERSLSLKNPKKPRLSPSKAQDLPQHILHSPLDLSNIPDAQESGYHDSQADDLDSPTQFFSLPLSPSPPLSALSTAPSHIPHTWQNPKPKKHWLVVLITSDCVARAKTRGMRLFLGG